MINRILFTLLLGMASALISVTLYMLVDIINRGGPIMVPIIMCSVFSLAIIIERLYYFLTLRFDAKVFFDGLRDLIEKRHWKEAEGLCDQTKGPVARITKAGLGGRDHTALDIERVMEEAAHDELPALERNLRWLSTIAQVSTLLGLLGTVTGLVAAFQVVQTHTTNASPVNPADLAGGIWEALITTVGGLEVAIPTILAYNYLTGQVHEVQYQMEKAAAIVAHWRRSGTKETV